MSSRAPAGVSATRYSSGLISLTTPTFIRARNPSFSPDFGVPDPAGATRYTFGTFRLRHVRRRPIHSPWRGGRTNRAKGSLSASGADDPLDETALVGPKPGRLAGVGVLTRVLWVAGRRDRHVHPLIRERPLDQRLGPGRYAEVPQRGECLRPWLPAQERPLAEGAHHEHGDPLLLRKRQDALLAVALERVQRHLHGFEMLRPQNPLELVECSRVVMRDTDSVDPARVSLRLEPRQVLLPRYEVVHLLDLDAAEPLELPGELRPPLLDGARPDLGRDDRVLAPILERRGQRALGLPVHRRGIHDPSAGLERSLNHTPSEVWVASEAVPGSEPDDRPQPPFLHQGTSPRATLPAAKAAAKNHGSTSGPRPMWESGSPAHASSQPSTSTSTRGSSHSGASRPFGHAIRTSPRQSSTTARVWCETPRCRSRSSAPDTRTASTGEPPSALAKFAAAAAATPPWPSLEPVPTIPGPTAQATASWPAAAAHASAEATLTHSTSPPKHAPWEIVLASTPRPCRARTVSESPSESAPPSSWTYATRTPSPRPAHAAASWLWREQHTTGIPPSSAARSAPSSACSAANCPGVYGSLTTCAPSSAGSSSPRVRFA